jgi:hypothetical protein
MRKVALCLLRESAAGGRLFQAAPATERLMSNAANAVRKVGSSFMLRDGGHAAVSAFQ